MKTRKISKTSKRRLAFFGTLSLVIIVYAVFTTIYYGVNLLKVKNKNKSLENELKELQNSEENLKIEIQKLKDPEYIARYARENYLYSKDGEYVIKFDTKEEKEEKKEESNNYIYYLIVGVCLIVIIVIVIPKPKKNKPA